MESKEIAIYVHIPFCMSKCSYCSFVSKCASKEQIDEYFKMLNVQILAESGMFKDRLITTIYIGGGTPSFVDVKHIESFIKAIKDYYNVSSNAEITIECNPCSTTLEKLKKYYNLGINRISFGIQSLNDDCLKIIGRKHTSQMAIDVINLAKRVGFENVSADILIGIPNQTKEMLLNDIKTLASAGLTHISAYMLMLEEGTKLYEQTVIDKTYRVASDDECVDMYNSAYMLLNELCFKRYEISNFSKPRFESKHNINYWDMGEYVGFGLSAHSFYNGYRIAGFEHFDNYYKYISEKYILRVRPSVLPQQEKLTLGQKIEECIMLGLRQEKGVNLLLLNSLGYNLLENKKDTIKLLKDNKFIDYSSTHLYITPNNFGASNQIILNLLP